MRVFSRSTLKVFWEKHPDAEQPLKAWFAEAEKASWKNTRDVRNRYRTADFVAGDRIVFNIGGNKYRLIVMASYARKSLFIRFVGTHREYDDIDAETI